MKTRIGNNINEAIELLKNSELVAIPTETVYGLAANGLDEKAISKIFKAKKRPLSNPLILHFKDLDSLSNFVTELPLPAEKLAKQFWPGPLTLLLDKADHIPAILNSGKKKIAVRIPDHPIIKKLLERIDFPIAAPSANLYGRISPTQAIHVSNQLDGVIAYILDGGPCSKGLESTIVGFDDGNTIIYRLGAITTEEIEACIDHKALVHDHKSLEDGPIASGMVKYHYAPQTPLYNINDIPKASLNKNYGYIGYHEIINGVPAENQFLLSKEKDLGIASSNLYHALHYMDKKGFDGIFICQFPSKGLGKSMNDRIQKAIAKFKK